MVKRPTRNAQEVDSQITMIYPTSCHWKMMHYKRSIIDVLKDVLPELDMDEDAG